MNWRLHQLIDFCNLSLLWLQISLHLANDFLYTSTAEKQTGNESFINGNKRFQVKGRKPFFLLQISGPTKSVAVSVLFSHSKLTVQPYNTIWPRCFSVLESYVYGHMTEMYIACNGECHRL